MEQKIKSFIIESGVFNSSALCKKTGIDRLHFHRWMNDEKELQKEEVNALGELLKKFGFKLKK